MALKKKPGKLRKDSVRKRETLIRSATELFLEKGYEGASMNELVNRAGGSKASIYRHFKNKQDLFIAVVDYIVDKHNAALMHMDTDETDLEKGLRNFAELTLDFVTSRFFIDISRVVYQASTHIPEVGRTYYEHGPDFGETFLADYIRAMAGNNHKLKRNSRKAAVMFISLLLYRPMMQRYCGLYHDYQGNARKKHIRECIDKLRQCFSLTDNSSATYL